MASHRTTSLYDFMFAESASMNRPWFIDSNTGRTMTGTAVKARTDDLAHGLEIILQSGGPVSTAAQDSRLHEVVGIVSPNSLEFAPAVWASHKLGCTVACMGGGSTIEELKHQFSLTGTRTIFCHVDALERVTQAAKECNIPPTRIVVISDNVGLVLPREYQAMGILTADSLVRLKSEDLACDSPMSSGHRPSSIAFLCFSSGTTGLPKAVILPHSAVIAEINQLKLSSVPTSRFAEGDKALGVLPFSHSFALATLVHFCPHLGIATVVFKSMPPFDIFLQTIVRLRIGHFFLVPPLVTAFVKHPATTNYDLKFFKSALIAAAPLDGEMESAFQQLGGPDFLVTQGFGMTESSSMITSLPFGVPPLPGSVGQLLPYTEAKLVDEHGAILGPGQSGQLCVRGPQLCLGYLNNEQATRDLFDADGFLRTGDVGKMTADKYFYIVDRLKFIFKNKGYQVSPAELEAHLLSLEVVDDVGVIGRPSERFGEVPVAFVVLSSLGKDRDPGSVKDVIKSSVERAKSDYKWLHDVYFVQSIPRLPSGKVIGSRLKEMLSTAKPV
ncbi:hypothetical protein B0H16DRAFT_1512898 [Mycena metata]|uniref:Acetyl-CoA synthetase-like protein n=1 Tax=Mycena metata TaxID=1033252 RepID=A0AAD7JUW0_9AGAR|nr:hypothetical protein B0H16DRAFT_1512898 [Mycena metata]